MYRETLWYRIRSPLMGIPVVLIPVLLSPSVLAETLVLMPEKDNTLYESQTGAVSNGMGQYLFTGRTDKSKVRRALIAFNIAENIPSGAEISHVMLTLGLSKSADQPQDIGLHRVLTDWGEGQSDAGGQEGQGTTAKEDDATWLHTHFDSQSWQQAGGDFESAASASLAISTSSGDYTWESTTALVNDVQFWLDNPDQNAGWLLMGNESENQTAKRFHSGQSSDSELRPRLTIEYTVSDTPVDGGADEMPVAITDPFPDAIETGDLRVSLKPLTEGMTAPNAGASAPGDDLHLYVGDQPGVLWRVNLETGEKVTFADLSALLVTLNGSYDERGLLGFAFHPDYASNGLLYTYTSEPAKEGADFPVVSADHDSVIRVWQIDSPEDPDARPVNSSVLMRVAQPASNHNGGALAFDASGHLFIALGDGGGSDDQFGHGQNTQTPLGAILRIDPLGSDATNGQYGIPDDNPFVNDPDTLPEIYAIGLRNPFRMSIDPVTGVLYAADVGQHQVEEINRITAGGNYGWPLREGGFTFNDNGDDRGFISQTEQHDESLTDPVAAYDHDEGISVIGGFVSRAEETSSLYGQYIFGDLARTFNKDGRLFYWSEGEAVQELQLANGAFELFVLGFARDTGGALYLLGNETGNTSDNSGQVWRIMPEASVSLESGVLHIPSLDVNGLAYQIDLQLLGGGELTFEVMFDTLGELPAAYLNNSNTDAHYDAETGLLTLPVVTLNTGGSLLRYAVTMALTDNTEGMRFTVQEVELIE